MTKIFNFKQERKTRVEKKRRKFERLVFQNFLGAYSAIEEAEGLFPVELLDISKDGMQFQVDASRFKHKTYGVDEQLNFRLYFTHTSYIPVSLQVRFQADFTDDKGVTYLRYGCAFDQSTFSFEAIHAFVQFLAKYAELSVEERTQTRRVYNL